MVPGAWAGRGQGGGVQRGQEREETLPVGGHVNNPRGESGGDQNQSLRLVTKRGRVTYRESIFKPRKVTGRLTYKLAGSG